MTMGRVCNLRDFNKACYVLTSLTAISFTARPNKASQGNS